MAQVFMKLLVFVIISTLIGQTHADCFDNKNCGSCASTWWSYWLGIRCRWCPLTNACHAPGSVYNDCGDYHQVTNAGECINYPAGQPYNHQLAEELAKWATLAYVTPESKDKTSIQSTVSAINPNFELVEFVTNDCDMILDFAHCAAFVAVSAADNQMIISFRGTAENTQLLEQLLQSFTGAQAFEPVHGEVLQYNRNTHNALYPCVKAIVEEELLKNPQLQVMVTGHSLGGAQAQLTAVNLLTDGLFDSDHMQVYTFGQPRVGDKDFAHSYDQLVGSSWRLTNKDDPVPKIIPENLLGFIPVVYHTKREVFFDSSSVTASTGYKLCQSNEDDSCTLKYVLCLSPPCIGSHSKYFLTGMGDHFNNMLPSGVSATRTTRGQCGQYKF